MIRQPLLALAAGLALAVAGSASPASPASAADAPDAWLTARVKIALLLAEDVSASAVHVATTDGKVTLHGSVATAGERARAEAIAKGVAGVQEVRNLLQIVERSRRDWAAAAGEALQAKVEKRLDADPVLRDSEIRVESANEGVVLLDGRARTLDAHLHALQVARAVRGVKRVASQIESPDVGADDRIWHDATGPSRDIDVDTQGGVVTPSVVGDLTVEGREPAVRVGTNAE